MWATSGSFPLFLFPFSLQVFFFSFTCIWFTLISFPLCRKADTRDCVTPATISLKMHDDWYFHPKCYILEQSGLRVIIGLHKSLIIKPLCARTGPECYQYRARIGPFLVHNSILQGHERCAPRTPSKLTEAKWRIYVAKLDHHWFRFIAACRLFSARPLSEPILLSIDPLGKYI